MSNIVLAAIVLVAGLAFIVFVMFFATRKRRDQTTFTQPSENKTNEQIDSTLDSDRDRIPDTEEVNRYGTDPHSYDTDKDGIGDREEIIQRTDPTSVDTDRDNLTDLQERYAGTDPTHPDTDRDGISDSQDKD